MSERSKAELERIKRVIRGLQAKTEENGATEEESMAAAAKLGEMLDKYNLSIDEVGVREDASECRKNEVFAADEFASSIITAIGKFCTLVTYQEVGNQGHGCRYTMFGTPHDLEVGQYLYEICAEAMDYDWSRYMEVHGYSMKKRASFRMGFAGRVYTRLMEMKAARDARNASQSRALVVLKDQLVTDEWRKQGIKLVKTRGRQAADMGAYRQGQVAGDRVNLNNPLGGPAGSGPALR
jgi:hypothetical protein